MKVEIDADELCKLREKAKFNGSSHQHQMYAIYELEKAAGKLTAERDDLFNQVEELEIFNDNLRHKNKSLSAERDWWRMNAVDLAMRLDKLNDRLRDISGIDDMETWVDAIRSDAKSNGYTCEP